MSLKQECIDIIGLIMEPLKQDECGMYEWEIDSIREICRVTGEDVTYGGCEECQDHANCGHKEYVKSDVCFYNYGNSERNYIFSKKPPVCGKSICHIRNRKQLMDEMSKLKGEVEEYKNWYAKFGEAYSDFMEYAKGFAENVKAEYSFLGNMDTEILPIVFHVDFGKDSGGEIDYIMKGNFKHSGNQNMINIYYCMESMEATKRRIRHEILHYFLYMSGMKYNDDDAIFHYLCGEYDANAYKEMGDSEQELYDRGMEAVSILKYNFTDKDFSIARDAILVAIGNETEPQSNKRLYNLGMELLGISGHTDEENDFKEGIDN